MSESRIEHILNNNRLKYSLLSGEAKHAFYTNEVQENGVYICKAAFNECGYEFAVTDTISSSDNNCITIERSISGISDNSQIRKQLQGIRFEISLLIPTSADDNWRFCVPSVKYTKPEAIEHEGTFTYMEDRLTGNLVMAYNKDKGVIYTLAKTLPSILTETPQRENGQCNYLHCTQNGSLGYKTGNDGKLYLLAFYPYYEGDKSVALNKEEQAASAFYPLNGNNININLRYSLSLTKCESFSEGVFLKYSELAKKLENEQIRQKAVQLPFSLEESIKYRLDSLACTYKEFGEKGAGFFFHFDPTKGYDSLPSGFGTSFNTIPHDSYAHILEYGFTGRQINTALLMAKHFGYEWYGRGDRVVEFFIDNCILPNGWMYSLYDLNAGKPFFSFGDREAPKLHYISRSDDKGNYLRTMTEPALDILEYYMWYREKGIEKPKWLEKAILFAEFLVKYQNEDGSWYRGYRQNGEKADMRCDDGNSPEEIDLGSKGASVIPTGFLTQLCNVLKACGVDYSKYYEVAVKAGEYSLKSIVEPEHYQGGTLDNPNVVDKEAAQYAMAGMYHLYKLTGDKKYLKAAKRAANIFVTWNYIWNAPTEPDTILYEKNFKTKGLGAINSIWGGGVVDIYSLFHIKELYDIGIETETEFFCTMADWIATGTAQILSYPQDDMGFADIGMQPEGFGVCNQGIDEGMIAKGDIWGTLGWIYSAGIYGLERYLSQRR